MENVCNLNYLNIQVLSHILGTFPLAIFDIYFDNFAAGGGGCWLHGDGKGNKWSV